MERSLTFRLVTTILVTTFCISMLATVLVANGLWRDVQRQQSEGISTYIRERALRTNTFFDSIADAHRSASEALVRRLDLLTDEEVEAAFDRLFPLQPDGTRRSTDALFDGYADTDGDFHYGVAAFMASTEPLSLDRKRLLVAAYQVVDRGGEMFGDELESLYLFTPQNELVISASGREDRLAFYRQDAPPDFNLSQASFAQLVLPESNPVGTFVCDELSQLVFIQNRETLTTGCFTPVRINGRHVGAFGTTIPLRVYFEAAMADRIPNGDNAFINGSGQLIAHESLLDNEITQDDVDALSRSLGIEAIHSAVQAAGTDFGSFVDPTGRWTVGFGAMPGPDWYFATLVDRQALRDEAVRETALILGLSMLAVLLQAAALYWILNRQLVRPLIALAERFSSSRDRNRPRPEALSGPVLQTREIGSLARTLETQEKDNAELLADLENRVAVRTAELEKANQAKTDFLANMSHELRTPLNGICGLAQALESHVPTSEDKERARMIQMSGEALTLLLSDLLDMSKIDAGKLELSVTSANPRQVIADCHALFSQQAQDKGLAYTLELPDDMPEVAEFDALRVRQCLSNLFSNALKFTDTGEVAVRVAFRSTASGGQIDVSVTDSGIGMTPETLDRLFSPFVQADASIATRFGGTGLGLVISRELARLMDGDITATSKAGEGSTFHYSFQIKAAKRAAAPVGIVSPEKLANAPQFANLRDLSVLLVEDNFINREVAKAFLKPLCRQIDEAENGEEALQRLTDGRYDVVFMDMRMPVMDGLEATRRIRADGSDPPIIALTANASETDEQRCRDAGMDAFVSKPLQLAALYEAILAAIETAQTRPDHDARLQDRPV